MIERPNRAVLLEALDIFRDAMRPLIVQGMKQIKDKTLEDAIIESLGIGHADQFKRNLKKGYSIESSIDIGDFPILIKNNWSNVFSAKFRYDNNVINSLGTIKDARNKVSHPSVEDLDTEYTSMVLYQIIDILGKIKTTREKNRVEKMRDKLSKRSLSQTLLPNVSKVIRKSVKPKTGKKR